MKVIQSKTLVAALIIACAGCTTKPADTGSPAKQADSNAAIGNISWVITDERTHQEIGKGTKQLHVSDVAIKPMATFGSGNAFQKDIELSDHFVFELPEQGSPSGFGLVGKRDDQQTFSWEWFEIDRPDHATKIQESGELNFKRYKTPNGTEIVQTDFPTDISLRVIKFPGGQPQNPDWRIKILKGASIRWPSLVNGKVVGN